jgi:hypothetical protein
VLSSLIEVDKHFGGVYCLHLQHEHHHCPSDVDSKAPLSSLGCEVVNVLVTGSNGCGFRPGRSYRFLMAIKVCSTPSFGLEVKPEAPCHKILWHVKEPCVEWLRCYVGKIQGHFSPPPWVTARCLWCSQTALKDESGVLEIRWGCTIGQKMAAVLGTLHSTPPSNSNQ